MPLSSLSPAYLTSLAPAPAAAAAATQRLAVLGTTDAPLDIPTTDPLRPVERRRKVLPGPATLRGPRHRSKIFCCMFDSKTDRLNWACVSRQLLCDYFSNKSAYYSLDEWMYWVFCLILTLSYSRNCCSKRIVDCSWCCTRDDRSVVTRHVAPSSSSSSSSSISRRTVKWLVAISVRELSLTR